MKKNMKKSTSFLFLTTMTIMWGSLAACHDDVNLPTPNPGEKTELADEWYAGGKLGTTFNATASAYEDPTPAIEEAGLEYQFKMGEYFFERPYNSSIRPFNGRGPLYSRPSCESCHCGYGHGWRITRFDPKQWGNATELEICNSDGDLLSFFSPKFQGMPPFKSYLDPAKVKITWKEYVDDWGNAFPDGEHYSLIYPEVEIPEDGYYVKPSHNGKPVDVKDITIRLKNAIPFFGNGLIGAIDDDSLLLQWKREEAHVPLDPTRFKNGQWAAVDPITKLPFRFGHFLDLSTFTWDVQHWANFNVTRKGHTSINVTKEYALTASKDPEVQKVFYKYYPEWKKTGNPEKDIYNYFMSDDHPIEMQDGDYLNYMVWLRGLAVPAARNLDDPAVQRGKLLFTEIGCATCHRPMWITGNDLFKYPGDLNFTPNDARLPHYPKQKIWPYTDLVSHRLYMKNDVRKGWIRTPPLWGKGLMKVCTGHDDRLYDARARNVIEAIMWHGCSREGGVSHARWTIKKFRELKKGDRQAIVKFIESI